MFARISVRPPPPPLFEKKKKTPFYLCGLDLTLSSPPPPPPPLKKKGPFYLCGLVLTLSVSGAFYLNEYGTCQLPGSHSFEWPPLRKFAHPINSSIQLRKIQIILTICFPYSEVIFLSRPLRATTARNDKFTCTIGPVFYQAVQKSLCFTVFDMHQASLRESPIALVYYKPRRVQISRLSLGESRVLSSGK